MAVHRSVDIDLAASGVDGQEDPANLWSNRNRGEHGERKLSIAAREPLRPRGRTLDRQSLSCKNEVALENDWRRVERLTGESLICHLIPVSVVCLPQPEWRRHRSIDRHHDVVVHMLHGVVCRDWRDLPSVWHAEAEATCVDADVERIQQPSMDAHLFAGGDMRTLGNAFDIQSKTSEDRVFKAGNLVIELATECLDVIDLCTQSTKSLQPFDERTRGRRRVIRTKLQQGRIDLGEDRFKRPGEIGRSSAAWTAGEPDQGRIQSVVQRSFTRGRGNEAFLQPVIVEIAASFGDETNRLRLVAVERKRRLLLV